MAANKPTSKKSPAAAKAAEVLAAEDINAVPTLGIDTKAVEAEKKAEEAARIAAEVTDRNFTEEGKKPEKLPGDTQPIEDWRAMDHTYFPGSTLEVKHHRAFDRKLGRMRRVGIPEEYVYQWEGSDPRQIAAAKAEGWRFCLYDGGSLSGLDAGGFQGTDLFERTADGRVLNGDVYLMYMEVRRHLTILERQKKMQHDLGQKPVNDFMNDAYKGGIRGFVEDDWGQPHYVDPKKPDDETPTGHIYN